MPSGAHASELRAIMLAVAAVYPAIARETQAIETRTEFTSAAGMAANIITAARLTDSFRATMTGQPSRKRTEESHPPKRFPKPATANGIHAYWPIDRTSKCRALLRYAGNQNV